MNVYVEHLTLRKTLTFELVVSEPASNNWVEFYTFLTICLDFLLIDADCNMGINSFGSY